MRIFIFSFIVLLLPDLAVPFRSYTSFIRLSCSSSNIYSGFVNRSHFPSNKKEMLSSSLFAKRRRRSTSFSGRDDEEFSVPLPHELSPFTKGLLSDTMKHFKSNKPEIYPELNELMLESFYGRADNDTVDRDERILDLLPKMFDLGPVKFCPTCDFDLGFSVDDPWISFSESKQRMRQKHDKVRKDPNIKGKGSKEASRNRSRDKPAHTDKVIETQIVV
jgi:hypothetical protein